MEKNTSTIRKQTATKSDSADLYPISLKDMLGREEWGLQAEFAKELKLLLYVERKLVEVLTGVASEAVILELTQIATCYRQKCSDHIERAEEIFVVLGEKIETDYNESFEYLLNSFITGLAQSVNCPIKRDLSIISLIQKIAHYKIASYSTLKNLSELLKYSDVTPIIKASIEEERNFDPWLSAIAKGFIV